MLNLTYRADDFGNQLTLDTVQIVLDDLMRAREGFVLASDLHLVYLVTPINVDVEPDWELYYERYMQLSSLDQVLPLFFLFCYNIPSKKL